MLLDAVPRERPELGNFYYGKRCLVTGGAGFIGSHLADRLIQLGAEVDVVDDLSRGRLENLEDSMGRIHFARMDLRDTDLAEKACEGVEVCFHLASIVGGVKEMTCHQAMSALIPMVDRNVFEACVGSRVKHVLYTSTACVYPTSLQTEEHTNYLLKERDAFAQGAMPESVYGWAKLFGEVSAAAYHREFGLSVAIVRDFNVYGGREDFDLQSCHVIPALVRRAIERERPYVVWGTGAQQRSFVYVSDVVEGMLLSVMKIHDATPVNLGTPERVPIAGLANLILKLAGHDAKPTYDRGEPMGVFTRCPDIDKARSLLGWTPQVTLEAGLKKTIEWFRAHSHQLT